MKANYILLILLILISFTSCKKDKGILSTIETLPPEFVASKAATLGCYVKSDGGSGIADCGIYIGISASPETSGIPLKMGNDTGLFIGQVSGLTANTKYYIKAYAKNAKGESFGEEMNFTTPPTLTDFDNNIYETVIIGSQTWMAKNLQTTHFLNGESISTTIPPTMDISSESTPNYQWTYAGENANLTIYGKLYTWYTITDSRKICPTGWHIPSDAEWTTLENTLGGYAIAGSSLKEYGNSHWLSPYNVDGSNISCFSGLPGGYRSQNGLFFLLQNNAYFWSSTQSDASNSWARILDAGTRAVVRTGVIKKSGVSVRCIKD
jgi:uncharacterized protein (TIGR02145 family)